jgi:hypothetical protein
MHKESCCPLIKFEHGIFKFHNTASVVILNWGCHDKIICIIKMESAIMLLLGQWFCSTAKSKTPPYAHPSILHDNNNAKEN